MPLYAAVMRPGLGMLARPPSLARRPTTGRARAGMAARALAARAPRPSAGVRCGRRSIIMCHMPCAFCARGAWRGAPTTGQYELVVTDRLKLLVRPHSMYGLYEYEVWGQARSYSCTAVGQRVGQARGLVKI